jgi:hypothetical protein
MKKLQLHEYANVKGHWKEIGRIDITPEMLLRFLEDLNRESYICNMPITPADIAAALEKEK